MRKHQPSKSRRPRVARAYAALFAEAIDYTEEHLAFLRLRRDHFLLTLRS